MTWTQAIAAASWAAFFALTGAEVASVGAAWPAVAASAALVLCMSGLLARASARGDISIVGPVFALSPVFTVVPDALLSGAWPSPLGWLGLGLAVAGTVTLSRRRAGGGRLRALLGRHDARDALGAAVLLGVLAAIDRWGALALGPPTYLLCSHGATAVLTGAIVTAAMPRHLAASAAPRRALTLVLHGLLGVVGTGMQTTALTVAPAAYVNAVRRLSAVVAVLFGRALFGEPDVGRRLAAAALAFAGAACLLFAR